MNYTPVEPKGTRFTFAQKEEAVKTWLATGNLRIAASVVGCHIDTIESWKKQDWWKSIVESVKAEKALVLDNRLDSVVQKSLDIMEDRLANGDFILNNKTGEIIRKPVALKDATNAVTAVMTRQGVLQQLNKEQTEHDESVTEMLTELKKVFSSWSGKGKKEDVVDVEAKEINAVHDQWEEGLQEGSGEIYLQAGSEEEES